MSTPERQDDPGEEGYGGIPAHRDDDDLEPGSKPISPESTKGATKRANRAPGTRRNRPIRRTSS